MGQTMTQDFSSNSDQAAAPRGLVIEDVSKGFPGVQALSHVSFDVRPGEVHGLVGENGAGKSTLMAIASGTLLPDSGSVIINGETLAGAGPDHARDLGLAIVYQHPALMPDLTISENLYMGVPRHARPSATQLDSWARSRLQAWDESIGLKPTDRVAALVPEEKFIVEISKALAPGPSILILDEPTEHLSTDDVQRLFANIRELKDAGCAIVYISHRVREVREIADRLTVLRDGKTQGTYQATELDESQVINLIVGRPLETTFPSKPALDDAAPVILGVENLTGSGFNDVSFNLRKGEIIGLAGIQGNGQRELMRALAGLQKSHGQVSLAGENISTRTPTKARAAGVAYVPADRHHEGIVSGLSVRENLSMRSLTSFATAGIVSKGREFKAARDDIARFRIKTPSTETNIGLLSGGNQQKAVIASALASNPKVLLTDEPSQGVDVGARSEIYQLLRAATAQGTAVIVVSSDALELAGLCDRVIVFSRGRAVADIAQEDVSERAITGAMLTATSERIRPQRASRLVTSLAGNTAPLVSVSIAILVLAVVAASVNGAFLSSVGVGSMLALATTLSLVAFGQLLVMSIGGIDLSVGPLMGTLVVIGSFFFTNGSSPPNQALGWVAFFATALAVGFVNWVLSDLVKMGAVIATLATFTALQGLSLTLRPVPGGLISANLIATITTRWGPIPVLFVIAVLIALIAEYALRRTLFGMSLRGIGSKRESARIVGVKPLKTHLIAHLGCSFFAALAAIPLMARVGVGDASAGSTYTLISIAAIVIGGASIFGGRGSFIGALLGALLIVQLNAVTTYLHLDQSWSQFLLGGMMIAAVAVYSRSRELEVPR
ncbi:ATP-binding cassette domain-containing protein [Arthrobacter sp. AK01]|uniref:ATP-binding cassette domain-containing protein n=1 Tax=Arthrobacter sp. AK01 TaxID=2894084 RepID=UPI001E35B07B|nr:ATP-binding cassette domain-containing protein [Arthrobacter sp. AK01]MCD4850627.1 ATP-binding cassette domain-containing protein [Arthrobacter sp. AK01]